jgi:hypothetical protein
MGKAVDVDVGDQRTVDELRLVTELIVLATMAPGALEQSVIDDVLGVHPVRSFFPQQRSQG